MAPSIRPLRHGDLDAVVQLLGMLFAQEADFAPDPARQRRALEALLADSRRGVVLVAVLGEEIVGTVALLRTLSTAVGGDVCWLEDLVVDATRRGRGTGRALVEAAVEAARERGWRRVSLLTDADNVAAQALYRSAGFVRSDMVVLRLTPG